MVHHYSSLAVGWLLTACLCLLCPTAWAQQDDDSFGDFMREVGSDFDGFMQQAGQDFVDFMRNPWVELEAQEPEEKRIEPEPTTPTVYQTPDDADRDLPACLSIERILDLSTKDGQQRPTTTVNDVDDLDFGDPQPVIRQKKPGKGGTTSDSSGDTPNDDVATPGNNDDTPSPEAPSAEPPTTPAAQSSAPLFTGGTGRSEFDYAGKAYYLSNGLNRQCRLSGQSEADVANAYAALSKADYQPLLDDLSQLRRQGLANDWALFVLVKQAAEAYCSTADESIILRLYLLGQLGYKGRLGRRATDGRLVLFMAFDTKIYGRVYLERDGIRYYDVDSTTPYALSLCDTDTPDASRTLSMLVDKAITTDGPTVSRTRTLSTTGASVTCQIPQRLMDVYADIPQCDYQVYATAAVNPAVEQAILASLRPLLAGKTETEAAQILLTYVQSAFEYQTDDQQFGYEKPFFVEELFYYPYCDCEDRSVLYGYLVRRLVGLDVVYLDYPNHIATAVAFNNDPGGDYVKLNGRKYTVCDPTYIGAPIGKTMPQYKSASCTILKY